MLKKLSEDFSKSPFGRSKTDGKDNGTKFRERYLKSWVQECIENEDQLIIELNDLEIPMTSSFMEESFGGLVRFGYVDKVKLLEMLNLKSDDKSYIYEITDYITDASYDPEAKLYEM